MISSLLLIHCFTFSQSGDTTKATKKNLEYYIEICKDIMNDKEYAFGSKSLICSENGKKGFSIRITWKIKNKNVDYQGLNIKSVDIGNCNENDELLFLFDDNSKFSMKSWNKFNCDGDSYFDLYSKNLDDFSSKKVAAIRFVNGRSFESYTYKLTDKEQSYFIDAKKAFESKKFVQVKCDD